MRSLDNSRNYGVLMVGSISSGVFNTQTSAFGGYSRSAVGESWRASEAAV